MDLGTGIALLVAFLAVVVLIIRGQSPIIMLLLLAILWSAIAGIGIEEIQKKILQGGGVAYASAVIIIVFGAWFAQVLIQTGIAESVIRSAVELAGDRPLVTAMIITLVTALLFTSMYGVGAAIAIGIIALPIMMGQGIPPYVAAPAFTMGIGAGTFINLVQFGTFQKLFPGLKYEAPYLTYWFIGWVRLHPGRMAARILLPAEDRRASPRPPSTLPTAANPRHASGRLITPISCRSFP